MSTLDQVGFCMPIFSFYASHLFSFLFLACSVCPYSRSMPLIYFLFSEPPIFSFYSSHLFSLLLACVLAHSLRKTGTARAIVVIYTDDLGSAAKFVLADFIFFSSFVCFPKVPFSLMYSSDCKNVDSVANILLCTSSLYAFLPFFLFIN